MLLLADALARSSAFALEDEGDDRSAEEAAHSADSSDHSAAPDAGRQDVSPAGIETARSSRSHGSLVPASTAVLAISSFLADAPTDVFRAVMSFV
jgi:hypothetical protein